MPGRAGRARGPGAADDGARQQDHAAVTGNAGSPQNARGASRRQLGSVALLLQFLEVLLELEPLRRSFESSLSARHEAFPFVIDSKQRLLSKPSMQALEELEASVAASEEE